MSGEQARAQLEALWEKLQRSERRPTLRWSYTLTPPFPGDWPPRPNTHLLFYAYAQGHDMTGGLHDGVHIAGPWARIEERAADRDRARIKILSRDLNHIGVQGVSPISREELLAVREEPIRPLLASLMQPATDPPAATLGRVRSFYRTWIRENGVIAERLRPFHPAVFEWVAGPSATVIVCDLFHAAEPDHEHTVTGFDSWEAAVEYARRRVRDSLEGLRQPGQSGQALRDIWRSFGEDARAIDADTDRIYVASSELARFMSNPATPTERDWLALQPAREI
nr:hypothetical protein [Thermoleophilia bacterium]